MDTRDKVSAAITALPEKSAYLIFDQGVRDRATAIEFYDQKDMSQLERQWKN